MNNLVNNATGMGTVDRHELISDLRAWHSEALVTVSDEFFTWAAAGEAAVRGGSKPLPSCVIQDMYTLIDDLWRLWPM